MDCCNIHRIVKGDAGERTGWRFLTDPDGDKVATRLMYVDTKPPRLVLDPRIKLVIHPDDVRFGFLIQGTLYDEGAGPEIVRMICDTLTVDEEVSSPFRSSMPTGRGTSFVRIID